ncbi:MAG TPA: ABC transporter substrate-binding protein [Syntrophomonas sp.]|nr:ABC transporter substrate-binding protein [Syntrophomonas sp.]
MRIFKKWGICLVLLLALPLLLCACSQSKEGAETAGTEGQPGKVPILNMAWDFDLHGAALLAAVSKGEEFKESGYYLKEVVAKEQYELYEGDKKLALVNTIVTKGSSETAVMMGQKQIDCCVNSSTGMMSAKDQGTAVQILCPIHVDGISLVFPPDTDFYGWDAVKNYIKSSDVPVKIGYHSPTSAPRVLIQKALVDAGLVVSEDPNDLNADIVLVNLNGSKNLLSSLSSGVVDAWIGPSHYPELAESQGVGKTVLKLKDFPPEGQWYDFPCCVFAARKDIVDNYPEVMNAMVDLLTYSADWCQNNRGEAAPILAEIIGISEDVVKNASIIFTTDPTDKWMEGEEIYIDMLNELGIFEGDMKGKALDDVKGDLFNFTFLES